MKATVQDVAKRSWRIEEFAHRNSISRAKAYLELKEGRLNGRKVGSATIVTDEDEAAWLASLPAFKSTAA